MYNSESDYSDSHITYDKPGLRGTSQELREVLNYSSDTDWIGITPTSTEHSFTAEEKINIVEQDVNTF